MPNKIDISLSPAALDSGSPEERAGFGVLTIETGEHTLTEGIDQHEGVPREGPRVSGYHLAEWLVWNWWRLRWEWWHRTDATDDVVDDWDFAHRMSTVGEGYEWPNISIASDGFQTVLVSERSHDHREVSFRYFGSPLTSIPAIDMETAVDRFVSCMVERMDESGLGETNLHHLWSELNIERQDSEMAAFRRLEARLGFEPDESQFLAKNNGWRADAARLGGDALEELAADAAYIGTPTEMMSAERITSMAESCGFDAGSKEQAVVVSPWQNSRKWGSVQAWQMGEEAAQWLRRYECLDKERPISNGCLAELAGVTEGVITRDDRVGDITFFLDGRDSDGRIVLGSKWETGRRFALARIIGDRLFTRTDDKMFPATRSYTYRQKAQRAFAAEFLCPFEAINDMLGSDASEERQREIGSLYGVSTLAVQTSLVNKGRISRYDASGIVDRPTALE